MKLMSVVKKPFVGIILALLFSFSIAAQTVPSEDSALTLAKVFTALQSTSSGMSLSQKNSYVIERVKRLGVTFSLSTQIEKELRDSGASISLINAIRDNGPQTTRTVDANKPTVKFDKIWVDYNVVEKQRKGMRIHLKFTVAKMKGTEGYLAVYFEKQDGEQLKSENPDFSSKNGQLAVYRKINPNFDLALFEDLSAFIPYDEFGLAAGKYDLKLDADLIYKEGNLIQHLSFHEFTFTQPKPVLQQGKAEFERMWVDYNETVDGQLGMRIHTKMKLSELKDVDLEQVIFFEKQDGTRLTTSDKNFSSSSGQVAVYRKLRPGFDPALFSDLTVFIPYSAFNLEKGVHDLRMHSDLVRPNGSVVAHLTFYNFKYTKR